MNLKKWILLLLGMCTSLILCSCVAINENKEMGVRDYLKLKATRQNERDVETLLQQLTSPDFFEHTEAARALIRKGSVAVPLLYKCRQLRRHINGCSIPVCMIVLQRIFSQGKESWLKAQLSNPWVEISKLAKKELNKPRFQRTKIR